MSLKFHVKNLGKIKDATFNVSSMTVITGPNGTGKSFFSKTIYSMFKTMEEATTLKSLREFVRDSLTHIERLKELHLEDNLTKKYPLSSKDNITCDELHDIFSECNEIISDTSNDEKTIKKMILELFKLRLNDVNIINYQDCETKPSDDYTKNNEIIAKLLISNLALNQVMITIIVCDHEKMNNFATEYLLNRDLSKELINNFQVESISEILSSEQGSIILEDNVQLDLFKKTNKIKVKVESCARKSFVNRPSAIFLESPAYWRVRDALVDAKMNSGEGYLSGVPKYFFDLNSDLMKRSSNAIELENIYELLNNDLCGEFIFSKGSLFFKEATSGNIISKNLVSFGMTNLGILSALIKNNVIKKDCYIFIDEPETNLHPDWQVLMIRALVLLSEAGVNVVINTHSTEILKYIEMYYTKKKEEEGSDRVKELLSINYLDSDGTNLTFDSECPVDQTKEALTELSASYFGLFMGKI